MENFSSKISSLFITNDNADGKSLKLNICFSISIYVWQVGGACRYLVILISFLRLPCIGDKRLVAACETDRTTINKLSVGIDSVLLSAYLMLLFDALSHPLLGCGQ